MQCSFMVGWSLREDSDVRTVFLAIFPADLHSGGFDNIRFACWVEVSDSCGLKYIVWRSSKFKSSRT